MGSHRLSPPPQSEKEDPYRNWADLPWDMMGLIIKKLGAVDILSSVQFVCSSWYNICKDPSLWRSIEVQSLGKFWQKSLFLERLCANAVDRSCGGLTHLYLELVNTDGLMQYIADRSSNLKQFRMLSCYDISNDGLSEAAKKFPLLEELEISYCMISGRALEDIGLSCPLLRSLKLNVQGYKKPVVRCNQEAFAIAQTMPNLRYLQLFGNKLTDDGVQAILNGCPYLESLDLRQCFNVHLEGDLIISCTEQIKDLRYPNDTTDDYPFSAELPQCETFEDDSEISDVDITSDDDDHDYYESSSGDEFSDSDDSMSIQSE